MNRSILGFLLALCAITTPLCLSAARVAPTPLSQRRAQPPSSSDIFYFLLIDRFADGDSANNKGFDRVAVAAADKHEDILRHGFEPSLEDFYHGGDLRGIIQKLDYLQGLGVTAVWLSPIQKNRSTQFAKNAMGATAAYHGYWIQDFTRIDPHWGREDDLKEFVQKAHQRNIKVYLDVIVNHTADMISYRECSECPYRSREDFPYASQKDGVAFNQGFQDGLLSSENFALLKNPNYAYTPFLYDPKLRKTPEWLNEPIYYHNRGQSTFSGENAELGDFYGLDDLFTEHPRVVQGMIAIYSEWIRNYKIDGFRLDTVKHVNIEFWQQFVPALKLVAKESGIKDFHVFGEVFSGDSQILSRYTRQGKIDSVLDFRLQGALKEVFAEGQSPDKLKEALAEDDLYRQGSSPQELKTFLSNHDIGRFAYALKKSYPKASDAELMQRLRLAYAYLFLARGSPVLYYGDEQGFIGFGRDLGAREDLFLSKTPSYRDLATLGNPPAREPFNRQHLLYQALAELSSLRRSEDLFGTGEMIPLENLPPKVFGFRRTLWNQPEELWVLFNNDTQPSLPIEIARERQARLLTAAGVQLAGNSLSLKALEFAIVKVKKSISPPKAQAAASWADRREGARVSGLFFEELKLSPGQDYRVLFSIKTEKQNQFQKLYTDATPPFRAYIDGSLLADGTKITLKAEIEDSRGGRQSLLRSLTVDSRPITIDLQYEHAGVQAELLRISDRGEIASPLQIGDDQQAQFPWALEDKEQTLLVSHLDASGRRVYERPFQLRYERDLLPHLEKGPQGEPLLKLYVNNQQKFSFSNPQPAAGALPEALGPSVPLQKGKLYVRGGMNTWQARDELIPSKDGTYKARIYLDKGRTEFKIADAEWSAASNLGGPFTERGFTIRGDSKNLSFVAAKAGFYLFELAFIPSSSESSEPSFSFLRIEPVQEKAP